MLLRFRAANVLSLRGEFELSLLSPGRVEHARAVGVRAGGRELAVLPLVAIFGANASGKSNVLLAMRWMVQAVTQSVTEWLHAYPGRHKQVWFERDAEIDEPYRFPSDWLKGNRRELVALPAQLAVSHRGRTVQPSSADARAPVVCQQHLGVHPT